MSNSTSQQSFSILRLFLTGAAMGAADIVPGVSGGTVAFILGIYQPLIEAIKSTAELSLRHLPLMRWRQFFSAIPWRFLLPVFGGILLSVMTLAPVLDYLLRQYPVMIWSAFFGLILASSQIVSRQVKIWNTQTLTGLATGTLIAYWITGLVPGQTPANLPLFFLSGMIAIMAMILPGISGSFLLLVMGKYQQILSAVVAHDLPVLISVAGGAIVGLAMFSKILSWLFHHHHNLTVAILTGFMLGSLRKVWPWKEVIQYRINSHGQPEALVTHNFWPNLNNQLLLAVMIMLLTAGLVWYLESRTANHRLYSR